MTRALPFGFKLAACVVPLLAALPTIAQDDDEAAFDRTPVDCVRTQNIDSMKAVDDQNLIIRMDGHKVYRNHLPRKCPGLARENRFAYETRNSRLCSIDMITVLEEFGFGFRPGFTCRLGEFVPLSPEEVEDLDMRARRGRRPPDAKRHRDGGRRARRAGRSGRGFGVRAGRDRRGRRRSAGRRRGLSDYKPNGSGLPFKVSAPSRNWSSVR